MLTKTLRALAWAALLAVTFAVTSALLPNRAEAFSCVRHIYNKSSCAWRATFSQNADPNYGNVYFAPGTCTQSQPGDPSTQVQPNVTKELGALPSGCNTENGPCTIPAYCSVQIQFTYTSNRAAGSLSLQDAAGSSRGFAYDTKADGTLEQCPYLRHSGNTGGASVNDPANGDVSIGQCNW